MPREITDGDSELRRRAAWLLGLLVLVAVLIVVVFTTLLRTDHGSNDDNGNGAPGPGQITATGPTGPATSASAPTAPAGSSGSTGTTGSSASATASGAPTGGPTSCPTSTTCAFDTDIGNAVAAINAYRKDHDMGAVPASVSAAAKACAINRGDGCSGGWAETEVPAPVDGSLAVQKISERAKFLDPSMKAIEIGWAYDPGSKTYYFATIRKT